MKKISLKNLNLKEVDQLSREQLRNVLGGNSGSDEGGPGCRYTCNCGDGPVTLNCEGLTQYEMVQLCINGCS